MRLINPPFKLCEEVIATIKHFEVNGEAVSEELVNSAIGKTGSYLKRAIDFLIQLNIVSRKDTNLLFNKSVFGDNKENLIPASLIKKGITNFGPFKEYVKLLQSGKTEKVAIKLIKATYSIQNENEKILEIFNSELQYLGTDIPVVPQISNKVTNIPKENNFFWINEEGHLVYDELAHTNKIVKELESKRFKNPAFIDQSRIDQISKIQNSNFDLSKLVRLCEEINDCYQAGNYFSVGVLVRAVLDHVPPVFGKRSFLEIANNHGTKSFKDVMSNLENFSRKIADGILHTHIRRRESLPNATTVDCRAALDILLGEIVNELK